MTEANEANLDLLIENQNRKSKVGKPEASGPFFQGRRQYVNEVISMDQNQGVVSKISCFTYQNHLYQTRKCKIKSLPMIIMIGIYLWWSFCWSVRLSVCFSVHFDHQNHYFMHDFWNMKDILLLFTIFYVKYKKHNQIDRYTNKLPIIWSVCLFVCLSTLHTTRQEINRLVV